MLLKNHLIEVFKQASLENNSLLKDNVVHKWVHRFGIDSLNDLLIHSSLQKENQHEEENQEQISLIDEMYEEENQGQISLINELDDEENQGQIRLESLKTLKKLEETNCESNYLKISNNNQVFKTKQDSNQVNQYINDPKLPLPNIKNLRKWINKDKRAS